MPLPKVTYGNDHEQAIPGKGEEDNDDELEKTPSDLVDILGFDPLEPEDTEEDDDADKEKDEGTGEPPEPEESENAIENKPKGRVKVDEKDLNDGESDWNITPELKKLLGLEDKK